MYVSWEQTVCGCPLPTGHYSSIKGLRHMVIQIQFRYSQLRGLQHREHQIGQVNSLVCRKGLKSTKRNGWCPDLFIWIFEPSLMQKQTRLLSCSAAARWPCTPAQPQRNYWGATPGDRDVISTPPAWAGRQGRQAAFKMSTSELVALAAAPLEMWLGAVRQWEVLKKPWCWKYSCVGWSGKSLLHSGVTKPLLVEAEPLHSARPIWLL